MRSRYINAIMLGVVTLMAACATVQQLAIKADMAYATSVFALDDAEYAACHPDAALPAAVCADLDAKTAQALQDVQAVTRAIQTWPTTVPKDLPALLSDLNAVQQTLAQLQRVPLVADLSAKVSTANANAIDLLTHLTGGK